MTAFAVKLTGSAIGTKNGKPHVVILKGRYATREQIERKFGTMPTMSMKREIIKTTDKINR